MGAARSALGSIGLEQGRVQHLCQALHGQEGEVLLHLVVHLIQVGFVVLGDEHRFHALAVGRHALFPQAADGQHVAVQGDLAGHGHITAHRDAGQAGHQRRGQGDTGRRAVLGHCALRGVDVQVALLELFRVDAVLGGVHAHPRNGQLSALLHHVAQRTGDGDLAAAVVHHLHLDGQGLAAHAGPCQTVGNAHHVGTVEEMEQQFLKYNACDPLVSYRFGFHAEYTTSREILERMAALGQKYHAPVYTHNSETAKEVAECVERYGMTPTKFLDKLGMFEYGGGGFHCVHMTDEDLQICKDKQVWVVTNPASNLKLASGIAPIQRMKDMGIGLAIGTDGPASNNCLDMFREMFLTTALQKVVLGDASALDALDVLEMATVGGAGAMGLQDCDVLAEGRQADMIILDMTQPNMQPMNNVAKNIVYSGSKQNVKLTMIAGRIMYEDGQFFLGISPQEVYDQARRRMERMTAE